MTKRRRPSRLEVVLANMAGKVRRATLHGRPHLVAPVSLIVPGVLNGSDGAILYPSYETARNHTDWNGMPIVVYHPTVEVDGIRVPVSARDPDILNESGIGQVFRSGHGGRLGGEAWFDEELTKNYDQKLLDAGKPKSALIYPRLRRGLPIEVSTGLSLKKMPAEPGATHNGKPYDFVGSDYRPDHLALLPDQKGACSLEDGCGIHNARKASSKVPSDKACQILKDGTAQGKPLTKKQRGMFGAACGRTHNSNDGGAEMALTPKQRKALVNYLTINCDCWQGDEGEKVLNGLSDQRLIKLKKGVDQSTSQTAVLNAMTTTFGDDILTLNAEDVPEEIRKRVTKNAKKKSKEVSDEEEDDETPPPKKATTNKEATVEEWLKDTSVPLSVRKVVANSLKREKKDRQKLVEQLIANERDPKRRQLLGNKYMDPQRFDMDDLEELVSLIPARRSEEPDLLGDAGDVAFFGGAGGGPVTNREREEIEEQDDISSMTPPTLNYSELAGEGVLKMAGSGIKKERKQQQA